MSCKSKLFELSGARRISEKARIYKLFEIFRGKIIVQFYVNCKFKYWKDPKYAKLIRYPTCLRFLELLLDSHFREAIAMARNAKEIDDQVIFWFYVVSLQKF